MTIRESLSNLGNKIKKHAVKGVVAGGLLALIGTTALKDNVHFGSVRIRNHQENQYVWGVWPIVKTCGDDQNGNIYTFGLIAAGNELEKNSTFNGNQGTYGLVGGENFIESGSTMNGNQGTYGLVGGFNHVEENSTFNGNQGAYGLLMGENFIERGSTITGNQNAKGIFATSISGLNFGSAVEIGLDKYTIPNNSDKE